MNRYGQMAQRHWQTHLPTRYGALTDAETYFSTLGREAEERFEALWREMAGRDSPAESYLEKVGRVNMARLRAEEKVLVEMILLPPEAEDEDTSET